MLNHETQEALHALHTFRDFLRWTTSKFNEAGLYYGHGTTESWDEAAALISYALHLPPDVDTRVLDARLTESEKKGVLALIKRRIEERIPLAYLTQEAWFADIPFYVDERVLIPRSPLAELIENHFSPWMSEENLFSILDLCTGSGCIAIACALHLPDAEVDGCDISSSALEVAQINCEKHDVQARVNFYLSDLFSKIPPKRYDLIISNPPYVPEEEIQRLPAEYGHEPLLALQAMDEGLEFAIRIMKEAVNYLADDGYLIIEIGNAQEAMQDRFPEIPFVWLEFERGGHGIFLLSAYELQKAQKWLGP